MDLDPFSHKVLIDRGSSDGVSRGQAVIDGAGVMGQVEEVHLHFSTVRLISDPNHALPVQINRTGLRTVAFGTGQTGCLSMPSVPREADVREGDLIVTSGLGDRFPGGYPVARVSGINREEGLTFAQVEAQPLAALDRGREVLLISAPEPEAGSKSERLEERACRGRAAMNDRAATATRTILITLAVAMVLTLLPLPPMLDLMRPYWVALVIIYWGLETQGQITLGLAFTSGLCSIC